jgi:hypothetical protein
MNVHVLQPDSCLVDPEAGLGPVFLVSGAGFALVMFCPEITRSDRLHWEQGDLAVTLDLDGEVPLIRFVLGESRSFEVRVDIRTKPEFQQEGFFAGRTKEQAVPLLLAHYPTGLVTARREILFSRQDMKNLKQSCLQQIAQSDLGRRLGGCRRKEGQSSAPASNWSPPDIPRQTCAPDQGRCGFIDFLQ